MDGLLPVIAVGAAVLVLGGGAAAVTAAVTEALIVIAAFAGVLVVAAVVAVAVVLKTMPAREARAAEAQAARVLAYEDAKRAAALERHQRALELAVLQGDAQVRAIAAGVTAVLAASMPAAQPVPARVIPGAVEKRN